eukprot:3587765-Pleurochrysis_carterae.AAC.2
MAWSVHRIDSGASCPPAQPNLLPNSASRASWLLRMALSFLEQPRSFNPRAPRFGPQQLAPF